MKRCLAALLVLCALLSLCACGAAAPETDGGTFSLDILDTGKSDCIIVCMDGVTVVNDAADEDDFDSICAALERRGVQRIDYLVLSHYDKDHIGSAAALVRAYPVGQILGPDYEEDSMYLTLLKRAAEERNTPFLRLTENYTVETENGSFTLNAINNIDSVLLSDLIGYEPQKKELRQNTEAFVSGRAANNVLLYGDAGTGKSTSVKAILNEYADRGLRMI